MSYVHTDIISVTYMLTHTYIYNTTFHAMDCTRYPKLKKTGKELILFVVCRDVDETFVIREAQFEISV